MQAQIRVMLVDDNPQFRTVLRRFLERDPAIVVVGEASDGSDIVRNALDADPDVVLMDLSMPGVDGLEATLQLKHQLPGIEVVLLSMSTDSDAIGSVLAGGASTFLPKHTPAAEIVAVLKQQAALSGVHGYNAASMGDSPQGPMTAHLRA